MCPSYLATRDEKDSTRGRAHVLQDVANGTPGLRRPGGRGRPRPVPVLQGLRARLPDRHRHGDLQVRGAVTRSTAARLRPRSHYALGQLPALGPADAAAAGQRDAAQQDRRPGRPRPRPASTSAAACRASPRSPLRSGSAPLGGERRRVDLGRLVHRPVRRRHRPGRDRAARADGSACGSHPRGGVLRPDLDHHRPARRPPGGSSARPSRRCTRTSPPGRRSSGWSRAVSRRSARTPPSSSTTRGSPRSVRACARSRSSWPSGWRRASGRRPTSTGVEVVAQPHCHHHAVIGWETDAALLAQTGATVHAGRRLLRAGRQLRGRAGALRGLGRGGRARPAARRTRRRAGRGRPGRRLLLPHPARRPGRATGAAPRRAAAAGSASLTRVHRTVARASTGLHPDP